MQHHIIQTDTVLKQFIKFIVQITVHRVNHIVLQITTMTRQTTLRLHFQSPF